MNDGLVSIVSPSYNGAKYLSNFLNSILEQDYDKIELLFIDDGSTDNTKKIIDEYKDKFEKKGYILKYFYQKNKGQAAAMNVGLANYSGEYFTWMDSDDILYSNSISKKVDFLENNKDCAFVFSKAEIVQEEDINKTIRVDGTKRHDEGTLFSDYIYGKNVLYVPGSILACSYAIKKCFEDEKIFESREGQNWQIMLPLIYTYKCGYMDDILMKIVSHADSHSRKSRTYRQEINRNYGFCKLLENTILKIKDMPISEKKNWIRTIKSMYSKKILNLATDNADIFESIKIYIVLKSIGEKVSVKESVILTIKMKLIKNKLVYRIYSKIKK